MSNENQIREFVRLSHLKTCGILRKIVLKELPDNWQQVIADNKIKSKFNLFLKNKIEETKKKKKENDYTYYT